MRRRVLVVVAILGLMATLVGATSASPQVVRVLVIKATWGPQQFTDSQVERAVFEQAQHFIETASFGQVEIAGTQTQWLRAYTAVPACNPDALTQPAKAAATGAGYDPASYNRIIYLLPTMPNNCPRDTADFKTGGVILIGNLLPGLVEHELGHTFGLSHAGSVSYSGRGDRRVFDHYGDYWDVMGSGYVGNDDVSGNGTGDGDYGALQKACGGWLKDYTQVDRRGVYTVDALELPSAQPQAFVIDTASHEYWVDHREPLGNDAYLATAPDLYKQITTGIEVHQTERDAVQISELQRQPDYLLPNGHRGAFVTSPGSTFALTGVFALDVLSHQGTTMTVRFRWIDRTKPSRPKLVTQHSPIRRGEPVAVVWHAAHDSGSGVKEYGVALDRDTPVVVPSIPTRTTYRLLLPLRPYAGRHRVTVTAVDYAGNRGKPAKQTFIVS